MKDFLDSQADLEERTRALAVNARGIPGARSGLGKNEEWSALTLLEGGTLTAGQMQICVRSDVVYLRTLGGRLSTTKNQRLLFVGLPYRPSRDVDIVINGVALTARPSGVVLARNDTVSKLFTGSYFIG